MKVSLLNKLSKHLTLFVVGGTIYIAIEIIWRTLMGNNPTHWSMFILGGLCFIGIGLINEFLSWDMPIWLQCLIGTNIILLLEFFFGFILNIQLKLNIWDYSGLPMNLYGQICLPFAIAWYALSFIAIILDDWLRYWIFNEDEPHYNWTLFWRK